MITIDNSKERSRIKCMFEEGDTKYNKGANLSDKEEGVTLILKGLKLLRNLYETSSFPIYLNILIFYILGETDKSMIETYKKLYAERYADIEKKIKFLEDRKKKVEEVESNGGNAMIKYFLSY